MGKTLVEMYEELLRRGMIRPSGERAEREQIDYWPWAVNSVGTTPIEPKETPESHANVERHTS